MQLKQSSKLVNISFISVAIFAIATILLIGGPIQGKKVEPQYGVISTEKNIALFLDVKNSLDAKKTLSLEVYTEGGGLTEEAPIELLANEKKSLNLMSLKSLQTQTPGKFVLKLQGLEVGILAFIREQAPYSESFFKTSLSKAIKNSSHLSLEEGNFADKEKDFGVTILNLDKRSEKIFSIKILNSSGKVIEALPEVKINSFSSLQIPLKKEKLTKGFVLNIAPKVNSRVADYVAGFGSKLSNFEKSRFKLESFFTEIASIGLPPSGDNSDGGFSLFGDDNHAPIIEPIDDIFGKPFELISFEVEAYDPDFDTVTISAEQLPEGAEFVGVAFNWTPTLAQIGEHRVKIIATDDKGLSSEIEVLITVSASDNRPPVISTVGNKSVKALANLNFQVTGSDPDGDSLTYSADPLPVGATFTDGLFNWTPAQSQVGTYNVLFTVNDGKGGSASSSSTITVLPPDNRNPSINNIGNKTVKALVNLTFGVSGTDPDGDTITFSAAPLPPGATFSNNTFNWTPSAAQVGSYNLIVSASDGRGGSANATVVITVQTPDNRAPVIGAVGNKNVKALANLSFQLTGSDPDADALTFSAAPLPVGATLVNGSFSWTPAESQIGNYPVTYTVSDGRGLTNSTSGTITVLPPDNRAPNLNPIGNKSVKALTQLSFQVTGTDPDSDPISYSATSVPSGATFTNGIFNWTPTATQIGRYTVTFTASDGRGLSSSKTSVLSVTAPDNRPPVVTQVGNKTVKALTNLNFRVTATDPDLDPITFSATSVPAGATFINGVFRWTPTASQVGNFTVIFTANDGKGLSSSTTSVITVTAPDNRAPVIRPVSNKSVKALASLTFQVSATDPDADTVSYSASPLPSGATFVNRTFTWIPNVNQVGTYTVVFTAQDGRGLSASTASVITVTTPDNRPPEITPVGNRTFKALTNLSFQVVAQDPDNDPITYSATSLPPGATFSSGRFSWTPIATQVGSYTVVFTANDGKGLSASSTSIITVTAPDNRPPTIPAVGNRTLTVGIPFTLSITGADLDGDTLNYAVSPLPNGATFTNATSPSPNGGTFTHGTLRWNPTAAQIGSQTLTFTVSDGRGGSASTTGLFTVTAQVNRAPVISGFGNITLKAGTSISSALRVMDPDGDAVTLSVPQLPSGATFNSNGSFYWVPSLSQVGSYTVVFTARDSKGLSSSVTSIITVVP